MIANFYFLLLYETFLLDFITLTKGLVDCNLCLVFNELISGKC